MTIIDIVPDGSDRLHEIKYDGYRLPLERDGNHVRLITRSRHFFLMPIATAPNE